MLKMCYEHKYVLIFCAWGIWYNASGCAILYAELKNSWCFRKEAGPLVHRLLVVK